jgi:hypothetical protein
MKSLDLGRHALSTCVAAALLSGCGGSQPPISAAGAMGRVRPGPPYDISNPAASLLIGTKRREVALMRPAALADREGIGRRTSASGQPCASPQYNLCMAGVPDL